MSTNDGDGDRFLVNFDLTTSVEDLLRRKTTIGSVIESLSHVFTSRDVKVRIKSYEVVRDIVDQLPPNHLSQDEVDVIGVFLTQRLRHENSALPVVMQTVYTLCQKYDVPDKFSLELFDVFAKDLVVQQQQIVDRFRVYQTVAKLIRVKGQTLSQELKIDFMIGFLRIIEGERDPRCLLLIFQLFNQVVSNHDLGQMDEDAFEVISCYFPIAYNQPKNDPYNIARNDLAVALNACLASSPKFSQYGLSLIVDKVSADLETAKIDSYEALSLCCPVYGWESMKPFMSLLWNHIRKDVLRVGDFEPSDLTNSALKALSSLITELSKDGESMEYFLNDLMKDIEAGLVKSDLHLRPAAVEIAIASTPNANSFQFLFERITRFLLEGSSRDTLFKSKCFLLDSFHRLLDSKEDLIQEVFHDGPIDHHSSLISLCVNYLNQGTDEQLVGLSLGLLHQIVKVFKNISDDDSETINDRLLQVFTSSLDEERLDLIGRIFSQMQKNDRLTVSKTLFQSLEDLMNCDPQPEPDPEPIQITRVLILLDHLSICRYQKKRILKSIESQISKCIQVDTGTVIPKEYQYQVAVKVISVPIIFEKNLIEESTSQSIEEDTSQVVRECCRPFIERECLRRNSCQRFEPESSVLEGSLLLHNASLKEVKKIEPLKIDWEGIHPNLHTDCECFLTFSKVLPLIRVYHPMLVLLDKDNIDEKCLNHLEQQVTFCDLSVHRNLKLLTEVIACLSNKINEELVSQLIDIVVKERDQEPDIRTKLLSALNKGLVTRCHSLSSEVTNQLLNSLDVPGLESLVADAIIDCHDIGPFEREHLVISPFFHQKLFLDSLTILLKSINDSTTSQVSKDARRKSILGQLRFLPKNVIKSEVRRIQTLILTSLSDERLDIQMVSIKSLHDLISDSSSFVSNNLSTIVPRLLKACTTSSRLDVRKEALECLTLIAKNMSEISLLPLRPVVVKELKSCLGDKKRLVRMAAAEARCRWTMVGQPGNGAA